MVSISNDNITFQNVKFCHNKGVSIYVVNENIYLFEKVLFQNNTAENGAGIYMKDHSTVIFGKNSDAAFIQNSANNNGGAVFLTDHSSIIFDQNSMATFNGNNAYRGTIFSVFNCNVTFQAACKVTFSNNLVGRRGSAIHSSGGRITFTGNSKVNFINNEARIYDFSGAILSRLTSHISFEGNSITLFRGNIAHNGFGGAICSVTDSSISFKENSTTYFTYNTAIEGGAIYTRFSSIISFEEDSTTAFTNNTAMLFNGGAISSYQGSISFEQNSVTKFTNNTAATKGGAIFSIDKYAECISSKGNAHIEFNNNAATESGGAIYSNDNFISFEGLSTTVFSNNIAKICGGALIVVGESEIIFSNNSTVTFTHNSAPVGETVYCGYNSNVTTKENSTIIFNDVLAKWCTDTCLPYPYTGQDAVIIDSNGLVMCSNQGAFACLSENCKCKNLFGIGEIAVTYSKNKVKTICKIA